MIHIHWFKYYDYNGFYVRECKICGKMQTTACSSVNNRWVSLRWWEKIIDYLGIIPFCRRLYICTPYCTHLFQKFPPGYIHQIHKWTIGIILFEHREPNGSFASDQHYEYIRFKLFTA